MSAFRTLGRAAAVLGSLVLAACADRAPSLTPGTGQFRGTEVDPPRAKPSFVLADTEGRPYDFRRETDGYVTLLFFGYTSCPDICPVHLANIGAVLKRLDPADRGRIKVVFVSTDPDRDSAAVIRRFLDNFDPTFVGLRGTLDEVNEIQRGIGLPPATVTTSASGATEVGHAAVVLAFGTDDQWRLSFPFGIRQEDLAHDLPLLVRGQWTAAPPDARDRGSSETLFVGALRIDDARVPALQGTSALAGYMTLTNTSPADDWVVSVEAPGLAGHAMLHRQQAEASGASGMAMLDSLLLPAGQRVVLAPGGTHVMLTGLTRGVAVGDRVPLVLHLRRGGRVSIPARAIAPADAAP